MSLKDLVDWIYPLPLTKEDCPHYNVDHTYQCNLLPEPSECIGYHKCRTVAVYGRKQE
jgi:hypothetical protein